ncbi:hypothetical protein C4E04_16445 [Microvirga sp. 17 mud 1-3]|nr:hypothetical protein C4E04_16445 [Microvirga sp. 17 mud 1-3]
MWRRSDAAARVHEIDERRFSIGLSEPGAFDLKSEHGRNIAQACDNCHAILPHQEMNLMKTYRILSLLATAAGIFSGFSCSELHQKM